MDSIKDSKMQIDSEDFGSIQPRGDLKSQDEKMTFDQVVNSTGGYVYSVNDLTRVLRFLCLGTEGGSYYAKEPELKRENIQCIDRYQALGKVKVVVLYKCCHYFDCPDVKQKIKTSINQYRAPLS